MGYSTTWFGSVSVSPPLTEDECSDLAQAVGRKLQADGDLLGPNGWEVVDDGKTLRWDGWEKFNSGFEWLEFAISQFPAHQFSGQFFGYSEAELGEYVAQRLTADGRQVIQYTYAIPSLEDAAPQAYDRFLNDDDLGPLDDVFFAFENGDIEPANSSMAAFAGLVDLSDLGELKAFLNDLLPLLPAGNNIAGYLS